MGCLLMQLKDEVAHLPQGAEGQGGRVREQKVAGVDRMDE